MLTGNQNSDRAIVERAYADWVYAETLSSIPGHADQCYVEYSRLVTAYNRIHASFTK